MHSFIYQPATVLASLIHQDKATSVEVVSALLDRIKKHNHKFNALISVFEEEALQQATICDEETQRGISRGPLHGVPVTIKESFWIKGRRSTMNLSMFKNFVADEDAVVIERIKQSGAIILGQTNVPKGLIDYQVKGDIYPEGKNPYNTKLTPGGSTGGGAAALAAGFSPLELGTDFGGSVRVPAAFCGLYGLKPTEKTVPLHGNIPMPKSMHSYIMHMMQAGPLARNINDVELLWNIIKGPHPAEPDVPRIDWQPPAKQSLNHYKIAYTTGWPGFEAGKEVTDTILSLTDRLQQKGAMVNEAIPGNNLHHKTIEVYAGLFPYVITQSTPWYVRTVVKLYLRHTLLKGIGDDMQFLKKTMSEAFKLNASHYGEMLWLKNKVTEQWESFFREYDFLICPVAAGPAYKRQSIGKRITLDGKKMPYLYYVWPYVACFNASGHPCLTIPMGLNKDGLPLAVQIVTKYWNEPELLQFARQLEECGAGFVVPGVG